MVDAVVSVFLEKLLNTLAEGGRFVYNMRGQFEKLQNELQYMQCFLKDADRLKRKNEILRKVLIDLQEQIYEAEDILAECQLRSQGDAQFSRGCLLGIHPKLQFAYRTGKRLTEINEKITNIKENMSTYLGVPHLVQPGTTDHAGNDETSWSSSVYDHSQVVGLDDDKKMIKDWLFEADRDMLAIGIVGMGGLGKTTIARIAFNDKEIVEHFERRLWVPVSQTFKEEQIMRSLLRSLGDASVGDDQGELLKKINQYLLGKRYLIVMDDVWRENVTWWDRIYEGLPKGNGSCVIITSRIENVARRMGVREARIHRPKFLSKSDSWLLFRKIAFVDTGGECIYREIENFGKGIVDKCKGLPLAIKAVGGMMIYKPQKYHVWKRIADHFRDELAENDDSVMASLQLSYDELPSHLKSCFLSFSLYPEDCVITKEQLVHWWTGEGFVLTRQGRSSIEAGEDCFSGLTNRCLIEVVDKTYSGTIYTCKIHDMVRDLVIKVADDDGFFKSNGMSCRHLGFTSDMKSKQLMANPKLRALLSTTKSGEVNKIESNIAESFSECRYMRVLDISKSVFQVPLTGMLCNIGSLQHLTYLSLSNTHPLIQLPSSLKKLNNLQILDLSYCQNLKKLPHYLVAFKKLRVLDVSHCGSLEYLPKGLGRLSDIEVLLGFKPARSSQSEGCQIAELRNLTKLRKLELQLCWGDEVDDNEVNALLNLQELQFLSISCFDSHGSDLVAKLDQLCPPRQLHELCLKFYPGKMSPRWLNPISLPMLRYLSISSGNLVNMHQRFWGDSNNVWEVEGLMLDSLSDLAVEWQILQQVMPWLRIVEVSWSPELESFPIEDVGFRGGVWTKAEQRKSETTTNRK